MYFDGSTFISILLCFCFAKVVFTHDRSVQSIHCCSINLCHYLHGVLDSPFGFGNFYSFISFVWWADTSCTVWIRFVVAIAKRNWLRRYPTHPHVDGGLNKSISILLFRQINHWYISNHSKSFVSFELAGYASWTAAILYSIDFEYQQTTEIPWIWHCRLGIGNISTCNEYYFEENSNYL